MSLFIIGNNASAETGTWTAGNATSPQNAGCCAAVQRTAGASGTPDTAWVKISATNGSDILLAVWDNSGNLLVKSNTLTSASAVTTAGVWNQLSLASTSALSNGTTYWYGFQKSATYVTLRESSATAETAKFVAATWSTPANPGNFSGSSSSDAHTQVAIYFSKEAAGGPPPSQFFLAAAPLAWIIRRRRELARGRRRGPLGLLRSFEQDQATGLYLPSRKVA